MKAVAILFVIFAGLALVPRFHFLPQHPLFLPVFLLIVLGMGVYSPPLALMLALMVVLVFITDMPSLESFWGKPVSDCDNYTEQKVKYPQGAFYPLMTLA